VFISRPVFGPLKPGSDTCQTKEHLKGFDVVYKVSPHGKLPFPNDKDYNLDLDTYDGEFFQEDGLEGDLR
jgi:hypothetical protein